MRWHVTTFPDVLKSLSEGELLAGIQRYFLASLLSVGSEPPSERVHLTVYGGRHHVVVQFNFHSVQWFHR